MRYCPSHFSSISTPFSYNIDRALHSWIISNLKGRYYVGTSLDVNENNSLTKVTKIGFEDPKELSFFTLACPHLKYK